MFKYTHHVMKKKEIKSNKRIKLHTSFFLFIFVAICIQQNKMLFFDIEKKNEKFYFLIPYYIYIFSSGCILISNQYDKFMKIQFLFIIIILKI
jgi:hypothetical protein